MQQKNPLRSGTASRLIGLLLCALFVIAASGVSQAQSGRRVPERPKSPDPLPPKSSEPPIEPQATKDDKPQIPVLVVGYLPNVGSSSILTNIVVGGCLERLKESGAVSPHAGREMNRKQASDAAKATTDTYVVWIELEADVADMEHPRSNTGYIDPRYVYVNFVVFSPGTGKIKTSGHVYQRNRGIGGVPLPGPLPRTTSAAEYSLKYAGRETADRVFDTLGLAKPPERR